MACFNHTVLPHFTTESLPHLITQMNLREGKNNREKSNGWSQNGE